MLDTACHHEIGRSGSPVRWMLQGRRRLEAPGRDRRRRAIEQQQTHFFGRRTAIRVAEQQQTHRGGRDSQGWCGEQFVAVPIGLRRLTCRRWRAWSAGVLPGAAAIVQSSTNKPNQTLRSIRPLVPRQRVNSTRSPAGTKPMLTPYGAKSCQMERTKPIADWLLSTNCTTPAYRIRAADLPA